MTTKQLCTRTMGRGLGGCHRHCADTDGKLRTQKGGHALWAVLAAAPVTEAAEQAGPGSTGLLCGREAAAWSHPWYSPQEGSGTPWGLWVTGIRKLLPVKPTHSSCSQAAHPPIYLFIFPPTHPSTHPPIHSVAHLPTHPSTPPLSHSPVHLSTHALDCLSNHPSIPHMYPPICPCISLPTDPSSFQRSGGAKGRACREVSRASDEMDPQGYGPSPACSFSMASPVSSPCSLCLWLHSSFYVFFPS